MRRGGRYRNPDDAEESVVANRRYAPTAPEVPRIEILHHDDRTRRPDAVRYLSVRDDTLPSMSSALIHREG
jgi:hypothetical protein